MQLGAVLAALALLGAGAGAVMLPAQPRDAPASSASHGDHPGAHDHAHAGPTQGQAPARADAAPHDHAAHGMPAEPADSWSPPEGKVPDPNDKSLKRLANLVAVTDRGLAELAAEGFVKGHGTRLDPYVIEGYRVSNDLSISDTASYLIVRNNAVLGQLTLNWNGQHVHAHHNLIRDLRVNENVARTGDVTGGLLERNTIGFVGQLRHYEGEFRENKVGPRGQGAVNDVLGDSGTLSLQNGQVMNFDGFHRAVMHHNTFLGLVDIKLHGHHHGSSYEASSHDHAAKDGRADGVDHQVRYHTLSFVDNRIEVPQGTALIYRDTPHAGDDRTANSEPNEELELPHAHHTQVELARNQLVGGGLVLRVFNSQDERHAGPSDGGMRVVDNVLTFPKREGPLAFGAAKGLGMDLHDAQGLDLLLRGNQVVFEPAASVLGPGKPQGTGILLRGWEGSVLGIEENLVRGAAVGLRARDFDPETSWALRANTFEVEVPVDYDDSVANEPG